MRGVFEDLVIAVKRHQGLKCPKHWINYFSKENLNLDRMRFPDPHGRSALWGRSRGTGVALGTRLTKEGQTDKQKERRKRMFVPVLPGGTWPSELCEILSKWLRCGVLKDGAACFRERLCRSHVQVGRHKRYILSRIKIWNNFTQLALVPIHNVINLLAALPTLSMFSKSFQRRTQECPRVYITRLAIGSIFP